MAYDIRRIEYFFTNVDDQPGEAYQLLSVLADLGVNLLSMTVHPVGPMRTQLTLFPEDPLKLKNEAKKAKLSLEGPHTAIMLTGDDEIGALVGVHAKLAGANVNVVYGNCMTDGEGRFSYIVYIKPEDIPRATSALEV
jgi:predicted amino acid-binding ACT domain protein